ncbi:MAG: helical backbone metal receptor [Syntrophobacteraceae bacterium]|jgi:iron complex transport system substrate-binding protein|nr:helical backbone metal receptor [Syntrophobacteraceae bacterium]
MPFLRLSPGRRSWILAGLWLLLAASGASALRVTDDAGGIVELREPARRVIPLYGAFAEMLYAVGAGPQVAARTQADRFPPGIERLPSVGTHMRPNVELIIGLKPDLVVQSASRREAMPELDRLREAGIPVAVFAPGSFEDIFQTMLRLGSLTGNEEPAARAVQELRRRLEAVRGQVARVERPRSVFFETRAEPLTTAGEGSIVQSVLEAAGARNVVSSKRGIVQFNLEALLLADPDVYIVQEGPMNRSPAPPGGRPHFNRLRSVREGKVVMVDELKVSRPGPRSVDAVEELARAIYPERFP